jgi:hypothetical protein
MSKTIAVCGIDCATCPTFIATRTNDGKLRAETAKQWSAAYKAEIKPEDLNCVGCAVEEGPHFNYCAEMCEIRKCGRGRKVANCAGCPDYACDKLAAIFKMAPEAEATLDGLRAGR